MRNLLLPTVLMLLVMAAAVRADPPPPAKPPPAADDKSLTGNWQAPEVTDTDGKTKLKRRLYFSADGKTGTLYVEKRLAPGFIGDFDNFTLGARKEENGWQNVEVVVDPKKPPSIVRYRREGTRLSLRGTLATSSGTIDLTGDWQRVKESP
jgi:hypothetical protein